MWVGGQGDTNKHDNSEWSTAKAESVRALIENGADVNATDDSCSTPLHEASSKGSYETVGLLIEHGADVGAKDRSDRTPLHLASSWVCSTTPLLFMQDRLIKMTGRQRPIQWEH